MKFNQWTLALAALGVVSLASAAKAEEKMNAVQAALSSTTISGYVDTSAIWKPGDGNGTVAPVSFMDSSKVDGFNLNVVQLTVAKALDEGEWASGYRADLWFGPDANALNSASVFSDPNTDFAIRQAYVALRTPVGNGIDWKMGVFDTVIGYETLESGNNPNMTRSYGFTIEPTTHTGLLATYRLNDVISFSAGVANTHGPSINERAHGPNASTGRTMAESYKAYMGSIALTAPSDWGWASGSTLYAGVINGFSSSAGDAMINVYAGGTLATPVTGLKVGAAFDYLEIDNIASNADAIWTAGLYASYQASEKLSFHGRAEILNAEGGSDDNQLYALTGTIQYDLWENVISRLEVRWDYSEDGGVFGGRTSSGSAGTGGYYGSYINGYNDGYEEGYYDGYNDYSKESDSSSSSSSAAERVFGSKINGNGDQQNAVMVALQVIYKF